MHILDLERLSEAKYEDMKELVEFINAGDFSWKAGLNEDHEGLSLSELKSHKSARA